MVVLDGKGWIFGRIASQISKAILKGEEVYLINAEEMLITGNPKATLANMRLRRALQNKGTPEHSPKWPKVPHMLVKRMIRGMLPWHTARGREAYKRLIVYTGNPKKLKPESPFEVIGIKKGVRFMKMLDLCRMIGYSG